MSNVRYLNALKPVVCSLVEKSVAFSLVVEQMLLEQLVATNREMLGKLIDYMGLQAGIFSWFLGCNYNALSSVLFKVHFVVRTDTQPITDNNGVYSGRRKVVISSLCTVALEPRCASSSWGLRASVPQNNGASLLLPCSGRSLTTAHKSHPAVSYLLDSRMY